MRRHLLRHYISHVKRQPQVVQEMYAIAFATLGTALLVFLFIGIKRGVYFVLHPVDDIASVETIQAPLESPFTSFGRLFSDTKQKLKGVSKSGVINLFDTPKPTEEKVELRTITN